MFQDIKTKVYAMFKYKTNTNNTNKPPKITPNKPYKIKVLTMTTPNKMTPGTSTPTPRT